MVVLRLGASVLVVSRGDWPVQVGPVMLSAGIYPLGVLGELVALVVKQCRLLERLVKVCVLVIGVALPEL